MTRDAPGPDAPADADLPPFRAQHGEDRILFDRFGGKRAGYYVEVGAYNGVDLSNTEFFERIGWDGVLVEPHPVLASACRRDRPRAVVSECAAVGPGSPPTVRLEVSDGAELYSSLDMGPEQHRHILRETGALAIRSVEVPALTLDAILEAAGAPVGRVDFLTVDVEGHELGVLRGFDIARWRPRVVILERNGAAPPVEIVGYMSKNGYVFERRTGVNDWYAESTRRRATAPGYLAGLVLGVYAPAAIKAALRPIVRPIRRALARRSPGGGGGGG